MVFAVCLLVLEQLGMYSASYAHKHIAEFALFLLVLG